jgi:hypothetical protein
LEVLKVAYELHQVQNITLRKSAVDEKYIWIVMSIEKHYPASTSIKGYS